MRDPGHWTLMLKVEAKNVRLPSCFGTKELNERTNICKRCNQLEECKRRLSCEL